MEEKLSRIENIILLTIDYNHEFVINSMNNDFYILMQLKQAKALMGQLGQACVKNPRVPLMPSASGREKTLMGAAWVLMVQTG